MAAPEAFGPIISSVPISTFFSRMSYPLSIGGQCRSANKTYFMGSAICHAPT